MSAFDDEVDYEDFGFVGPKWACVDPDRRMLTQHAIAFMRSAHRPMLQFAPGWLIGSEPLRQVALCWAEAVESRFASSPDRDEPFNPYRFSDCVYLAVFHTESPIEAMFIISAFGHYSWNVAPKSKASDLQGKWAIEMNNDGCGSVVTLHVQPKFGSRRCDFALETSHHWADFHSIVYVECDGHDYHERSKTQAARDRGLDRAIQQAGHSILRFTGSELYRDASGCFSQAMDFVSERVRQHASASKK